MARMRRFRPFECRRATAPLSYYWPRRQTIGSAGAQTFAPTSQNAVRLFRRRFRQSPGGRRLSRFACPDQGLATWHPPLFHHDVDKPGVSQQGSIFSLGIDQAIVINIDKHQILADEDRG
jgi:hypothetical protein